LFGFPIVLQKTTWTSHLNPLPEWKDRLTNEDEGEAWKWREELKLAEAAYNQWREVFGLILAFAETLPEEDDEMIGTRSMIYQNAYIVAPKIISASSDTLYQIKMENTALIRFNCRQLWEQIALLLYQVKRTLLTKSQLKNRWTNSKNYSETGWLFSGGTDAFAQIRLANLSSI
jgi:hypothetical protein